MIAIYCDGNISTILKSDDVNRAKEVAQTISKYEPCYFECRKNVYFFNNGKLVCKLKKDKFKMMKNFPNLMKEVL